MRSWLFDYRQNKKLTHEEIATNCNISRQFYSMLESGERTPSVAVAKKIASVLDFDWTKFFEDDKPQIKETG